MYRISGNALSRRIGLSQAGHFGGWIGDGETLDSTDDMGLTC